MTRGIDVSHWQGNIDWRTVKASGIDFAIIKAGGADDGYYKDSKFEDNYKGCKDNGIKVGAYYFSNATTTDGAVVEAIKFTELLKGKQFDMPVYFDIEGKNQLSLGKERISAIIRAFLETMKNNGYFVGLYHSKSSLETNVAEDIRTRYAVWLAHWKVEKSSYKGQYGLWQYNVGKCGGISSDCDLDYCYIDYHTAIINKGLNGYSKPDGETPTTKPETKTVEVYVDGKLIIKVKGEIENGN